MNCICGYDDLDGHAFIRSELNIAYEDPKVDDWHNPTKIKPIFICPKCGTLKIEI